MLAPGTLGVRAGGEFAGFTERFGHPFWPGDEGRQALGEPLVGAAIDDARFLPLAGLRGSLNRFFQATQGDSIVLPGDLALEVERFRAAGDDRIVPFEVELGLLPRISASVRVPLVQYTLRVTGFDIGGGNLGFNPDPTANRALLADLDTAFAALGGDVFLPTAGSTLGRLLQEQVRARTGGAGLLLPEGPIAVAGVAGVAGADALRAGRYDPDLTAWELGDVEAMVSLQLAEGRRVGRADERGVDLRAALDVGFRFATGAVTDAGYVVFPRPEQGLGGFSLGVRSEWSAPRFGMYVGAGLQRLGAVTVQHRLWDGTPAAGALFGAPNPAGSARWEPGTRIAVDVEPSVRIVDELRIGAAYGFARRAGQSYTLTLAAPDGTLVTASPVEAPETAHSLGLGLAYSTVDAYGAGRAGIPFEARLRVRSTVAGSHGARALRVVEAQARLFFRLWGR